MSTENTPQANIPAGNGRTLKVIRWILLLPLAIAIPPCVVYILSGGIGMYTHAGMFAVITAQWFIAFLFLIPVVCLVAPSHKRKVSVVTCAIYVFFMVLGKLKDPDDLGANFFSVSRYGAFAGLLVGFFIVLFALRKQGVDGTPSRKKAIVAFVIILCAACVPLFIFRPIVRQIPDSSLPTQHLPPDEH